jgi:hypothetical protein
MSGISGNMLLGSVLVSISRLTTPMRWDTYVDIPCRPWEHVGGHTFETIWPSATKMFRTWCPRGPSYDTPSTRFWRQEGSEGSGGKLDP